MGVIFDGGGGRCGDGVVLILIISYPDSTLIWFNPSFLFRGNTLPDPPPKGEGE
jgi:hypothetical protein